MKNLGRINVYPQQNIDSCMDKYLQATDYCEVNNPVIRDLAYSVAGHIDDPYEKASTLFYWVRDNLHYRLGLWNRTAMESLLEREGTCSNKANLLVALLRAANIPAGYCVARVNGQKYFGPLTPKPLGRLTSKCSLHVYVMVHINGKWIKCDPTDDILLCLNTSYVNPQSTEVKWDGCRDAILNLCKDDIQEEKGPVANIDDILRKKPRNAKGVPLKVANILIRFARTNPVRLIDPSEFSDLFFTHLRKNFFLCYCLFWMVFVCRVVLDKVKHFITNRTTQSTDIKERKKQQKSKVVSIKMVSKPKSKYKIKSD